MYDFFNNVSMFALLFINFLYYKQKKNSLSRIASNLSAHYTKINKYPNVETIFTIVEILLVSFFQYVVGSAFNRTFGTMVGTGANYFSMLLLSPIAVAVLCFFIGADTFKQIDMITPAYPFTMIFVRLACFCEGCCYGMVSPFGLYNHSTNQVEFPVQLLEMVVVAAIFAFLMLWRKKAKEGTMFPTYLILYSATRFFTEFLSGEKKIFYVFNTYHMLCIAGVLIGILYLFVVKNHKIRIQQFYNDYFDAVEALYNDVMDKANPRRQRNIVHHGKQKKNKTYYETKRNSDTKTANMKKWILIWALGLMGQVGWNIESTWFSTYIYEKIDKSPTIMTPMLFLGAFASTIAVFLFGTISDRTGKRRTMMSYGFIIWGMLSIAFSFTQYLPKISLSLAAVCIIVVDMLISFFAAMSVSVGFNTWITDNMNKKNIGQIGGALAAQTVLGALLANVVGGVLISKSNNYIRLFVVSGVILVFVGWISIFLFDSKDDVAPSVRGSFFKQFSALFDYKNILKQKELVWVNITITVFFIGFSSYFPHLGNYITQYLGYTADKMGIIEALPMISAMFIAVPISKLINQNKFITVTLISIVSGLAGSYCIFQVTPQTVDLSKAFDLQLFVAIFLASASYIIMIQATKTWTKNLYPKDSKGQYEGLWAISYALVPMFFGSNIGEWLIKNEGVSRLNEITQRYEYIPNQKIFVVGALISAFSIIPIIIAKRYLDKKVKAEEKILTDDSAKV